MNKSYNLRAKNLPLEKCMFLFLIMIHFFNFALTIKYLFQNIMYSMILK